MKRIVVTAPQLTDIVARELDGCEIIGGDHAMTREELAEQIVEADALLSSLSDPLDADMLARATKLEVIGQCAAGFNNIDVDAARGRGIVVTTTPGAVSYSQLTLPTHSVV